jgi:glycine betaine transporter
MASSGPSLVKQPVAIGQSLPFKQPEVFTPLFWCSTALVLLIFALGIFFPASFQFRVTAVNNLAFKWFGGFYLWFVFAMLVAFIGIGVSPLGRLKLGGAAAKPEYSRLSWYSMLYAAGMGTGPLYWGPAEPLFHTLTPPLVQSTVATDTTRAVEALNFTFFHWGLHPWAIYGLTALAIALLGLNMGNNATERDGDNYSQKFSFGHLLHIKHARWQWLKPLTNLSITLAILFGVAATFGMGILQLTDGLKALFHWQKSTELTLGLLVIMTVLYLWSSLKGIQNGIKFFSNLSLAGSLIILLAVALFSPRADLLAPILKAMPGFIAQLPAMSVGNLPFADSNWPRDWTIKYWTWWIAWAPFVGIFIAMISRGRTIRQFVAAVLLVPTAFSVVWFYVFGTAGIAMAGQLGQHAGILALADTGAVLYRLMDTLPWPLLWKSFSLLLVTLFFVNSADSATYTLACLSQGDLDKAPPAKLQIGWGLLFALLTGLFLLSGGINLLQQMTIASVLPFSLILMLILVRMGQKLLGQGP